MSDIRRNETVPSIKCWIATILMTAILSACAQNMEQIHVPHPTASTPAEQCGVAPTEILTPDAAYCIAKVSGLKAGLTRWQIFEYADYVDVFNTTTKSPVESGLSVRVQRIGGRVVTVEPWKAVTVR